MKQLLPLLLMLSSPAIAAEFPIEIPYPNQQGRFLGPASDELADLSRGLIGKAVETCGGAEKVLAISGIDLRITIDNLSLNQQKSPDDLMGLYPLSSARAVVSCKD